VVHIQIRLEDSGEIARIERQKASDLAAVEALLDLAFGPDRYQKTAYRLRDRVAPVAALSFVARMSGRIVGTLRFWPVRIKKTPQDKSGVAALLLGPIAVEPGLKGKGIGIALMNHGILKARALGHRIVLLVGDPDYYRRVGFSQVEPGRLSMPGPVDVNRLMVRELEPGVFSGITGRISSVAGNQ
jgi:predicted N-acetyltransferase YhbS